MDIKLTDTEHALILENCRMQLHAMGHDPTIRFSLDYDEPHSVIGIHFDFCIFSIGYTFNTDGSTTEDIIFKIGDSGFIETNVYPSDTRDALVNRWITYDYSFWPEPKEAKRLQDEWFEDRATRLKEFLKSYK